MEHTAEKKKVPVVAGWHTMDMEKPRLIANRCKSCGDFFFPRVISCRNPNCRSDDLEEVLLSNRGKLWSFTTNFYKPPLPYVSPDPFVPYTVAVVDLPQEKLMVAGQVVNGFDPDKLKVEMEMELVLENLYEDDQGVEHVIWKWKPLVS